MASPPAAATPPDLLHPRARPWPCYNKRGDAHLPFRKDDPLCAAWPAYELPEPRRREFIRRGARRLVDALRDARAPRVTPALISRLMSERCVQRLCLHLQIIRRQLLVVPPPSRLCAAAASSPCAAAQRQRQPGVAMSAGLGGHGKWSSDFSPTRLEWHFAAGLNVSSCSAAVEDGDFNGAFSRLRLLTSLRLLEEAARHRLVADTELVLCVGETPLSAGGWCLAGAHPVFEAVTNVAAASLPVPHWLPRLRDVDFSVWDDALRAQRLARAEASAAARDLRQPKAVFRGGVYRLSVYSDRWRELGPRHTPVTPENWRRVGRTALLHLLSNRSERQYLDVNVRLGAYAARLGISRRDLSFAHLPPTMSEEEQARRFKYALNVEGHGGWADRLYKLLLSGQLVLAQDVAARLWFEVFLAPNRTHLVVDSNLRNLSAVVRLARESDAAARAMSARAAQVARLATSVGGIRAYVAALLAEYTAAFLSHAPRRHPQAVRFACAPLAAAERRCELPGKRGAWRALPSVRCAFRRGGEAFATLHAAAHRAAAAPPPPPSPPPPPAAPADAAAWCSTRRRRDARAEGRWCFDFADETACRAHSVGAARASSCARRPCVWTAHVPPHLCEGRRPAASAASCVAVCCPALCARLNRTDLQRGALG